MIQAERHDLILGILSRRGAAGIQELAESIGASPATVRRDLDALSRRGLVVRTHGGASLPERHDERAYVSKVDTLLAEKRRIGASAAALVQPGQTIGCGGGTTVMTMIRALRGKPLRVVTTAINVAAELSNSPDIEVTVTGGRLRGRSLELVGHVAERALRDVVLDVAVIGVDGLSLDHGLTTYDEAEAYVNRVLIGRAREVWVLADHSKFGLARPLVIAPLCAVTRLFTDRDAPEDMLEKLRGLDLDVTVS